MHAEAQHSQMISGQRPLRKAALGIFRASSWLSVIAVTVLGTAFCIAVTLFIDSFSLPMMTEEARKASIRNDVLIPVILAGPLLFLLMLKVRQLVLTQEYLQIVASTDGLTRVLNRGAFQMLVDSYLEKIEKLHNQRSGALLIVDVDHFKSINDEFGHDRGDHALKAIASSIASSIRDGDLVGRMGGEEFAVFLPSTSPSQAYGIAERVRSAVAAVDLTSKGLTRRVSVSIGGVNFSQPVTFAQLYSAADKSLYRVKNAGRNRVRFVNAGEQLAA